MTQRVKYGVFVQVVYGMSKMFNLLVIVITSMSCRCKYWIGEAVTFRTPDLFSPVFKSVANLKLELISGTNVWKWKQFPFSVWHEIMPLIKYSDFKCDLFSISNFWCLLNLSMTVRLLGGRLRIRGLKFMLQVDYEERGVVCKYILMTLIWSIVFITA